MRRAACPAIVLLLLAGSPAAAEPIAVTSGFVIFTDEPGDFSFVGPGFELSGAWFPRTLRGTFWFDRCHPDLTGGGCLPGARVDFGTTTYAVGHDEGGHGVIGGVVHEQLFYRGEWTFHGPSVIAPTTFGEHPLVRQGRFAFEGSIFAYLTESRTGTPLLSSSLRGSGTARVFFGIETGEAGDRAVAHDLHYRFDTQQPVPEPSTLLLIGAGLGTALTRFRRRRV